MLHLSASVRPAGRAVPARPAASNLTTCRPNRAAPAGACQSTPEKKAATEHFEPADVKVGECLLEDARDAVEACKNMTPEDEAACMLQHGCDSGAVHARLDGEQVAAALADEVKKAAAA